MIKNSSIVRLFGVLKLYRFGIIRLILNRLFPRIFRYNTIVLYYFDLTGNKIIDQRDEIDVTFIKLSGRSRENLFKQLCTTYSSQQFEQRIRQKTKDCYVGLYKGEIITYSWITYKEYYIDEINYSYPLKANEFFIFDCYVTPEFRGRGIYPNMLRRILKDYRSDSEYDMAYIGVSSANVGSARGIEKAGFTEFNRIRYIRWLNLEKWWGVSRRSADRVTKRAKAAVVKTQNN